MPKAFVFSSGNNLKGKFELSSEENIHQTFQEYSLKNVIFPFSYIEWSDKTWTIVSEDNGYALVEGRIFPKEAAEEKVLEAQRATQRATDIALVNDSIGTIKTGSPDDLNYSQLQTIIVNHLLLPHLNENEDSEIYRLREELYMLSLRHPNLQTIIQTRIISDKLDALQMAITGVAKTQVGIANDQAKRHKTSILGQAATLATLGRIAQDTDGVGEFFGD
ncbi:hypothetical protein N9067_04095 [Akkermansiaceae bacterium]|nr:hypothetical protein [Akkermansiaceae bacterium]